MRVLTFDVEEWFHILDHPATRTETEWRALPRRLEGNVDRILNMLADTNRRATFFCLGWVAKEFPQVVRSICDAGFEVASHSYAHEIAYEVSPRDFAEDLRRSISTIEDVAGQRVRAYRAPGFSITSRNTWVLDALIEQGIEIDCSIFPASRSHGGFEHMSISGPAIIQRAGGAIKEFPMNVLSLSGLRFVFSGGGYFRLLPYLVQRRLFASSNYLMTYFHPRDFDPGQPVVEGLSLIRRFKSYWGIKGAERKLRRLLVEFDFVDIAEADRLVDWQNVQRISVQ